MSGPDTSPQPDRIAESKALADIAAERARQLAKGWTPEHDDHHADESIALVAALFASPRPLYEVRVGESGVSWAEPWPWKRQVQYSRYGDGDPWLTVWDGDTRDEHDRRTRLVISGALIVAEIERLDREAASKARDKGVGKS